MSVWESLRGHRAGVDVLLGIELDWPPPPDELDLDWEALGVDPAEQDDADQFLLDEVREGLKRAGAIWWCPTARSGRPLALFLQLGVNGVGPAIERSLADIEEGRLESDSPSVHIVECRRRDEGGVQGDFEAKFLDSFPHTVDGPGEWLT